MNKFPPWPVRMFELCRLAGGDNVTAGLAFQSPLITSEWLSVQNPEVIVKMAALRDEYIAGDSRQLAAVRGKLMARNGWGNMRAVREGRVYVISGDVGPGPRAVVGVAYMTKWLFSGLSASLDPEAIHREYIERFQKLKYQGHYAYPDVTNK